MLWCDSASKPALVLQGKWHQCRWSMCWKTTRITDLCCVVYQLGCPLDSLKLSSFESNCHGYQQESPRPSFPPHQPLVLCQQPAMGSTQQQMDHTTEHQISAGLDVASFMPSSLYTEVCAFMLLLCVPSTLAAAPSTPTPTTTAVSTDAIGVCCRAVQGPTPGALQEMLDSIDKHTEQVGGKISHATHTRSR